MKIDLSHQNILVTGASRGIGRAIAILLASCGAKVAVHYHQNEQLAQSTANEIGRRAYLFKADLSQIMEVNALFQDVVREFGQLHAVVNNAGIAIKSNPDDDDLEFVDSWLQTMEVNLNAVGYLSKLAISHFREFGGGRFINISSRAAFRGDTRDYLAYAASKGGVVALTRSIARAYGKEGIMAFIVAPGFTRTDMAQDFIDEYGDGIAVDDIALNRMTEPKDIAPLVALLASGLADHATGGTFDINAGSYVH